jgi:hypothetical protein
MSVAQTASWHALLDLYERLPAGWTLIGGQMVHLHCAERGYVSPRPTDDADAVLDIRANPQLLLEFTRALTELDFVADGIAAEGQQHRWKRDRASIDVLIPDNVGQRLARRTGVTGSPTIQTPGGIQALHRSQLVAVDVAGRPGHVPRPSLVGALIMKAAAHTVPVDPNRGRHRSDFATLASLVAASDFVDETLSKKERHYLRDMVEATRADRSVMGNRPDADDGLIRVGRRIVSGS